jgi:hypothetical protein
MALHDLWHRVYPSQVSIVHKMNKLWHEWLAGIDFLRSRPSHLKSASTGHATRSVAYFVNPFR